MKEIIEKYKKYLIVNGCAYTTILSYTQRVACFLEQVKIEDISTKTIRDYFFHFTSYFIFL